MFIGSFMVYILTKMLNDMETLKRLGSPQDIVLDLIDYELEDLESRSFLCLTIELTFLLKTFHFYLALCNHHIFRKLLISIV